MYRKTYVKINNDILENNVKEIINRYDSYKYYIGVVKANAYGHGIYIVNNLIKAGINYLAVSSLEEAIDVRKYNKDIPILVLVPVDLNFVDIIIENNITIMIDSLDYLNNLLNIKLSSKINVHLKLDTGMNRLGINDREEVNKAVDLIKQNDFVFLEGIYTHIATSGVNDIYYDKAISKFIELTSDINLNDIPIVHINRSITLVHHNKYDFETGVRLGIIMYGFSQSISELNGIRKIKRDLLIKRLGISSSILSNNLKLKPAFSLFSEVISIKKVKKGEAIGYGASYIAKKDIIIAVIPIGYNDGIKKEYKYVCINEKMFEIVGAVCMDMIIVSVDNSVKLNDKVEIFGDKISVFNVTKRLNTNAYHLFTSITNRVPRLYSDNKEIKY